MSQSELIRQIDQLRRRRYSGDSLALIEFERRFGESVERIARRAVRTGRESVLLGTKDKEQPADRSRLVLRQARRIIRAVFSPFSVGETVRRSRLSTDTADW